MKEPVNFVLDFSSSYVLTAPIFQIEYNNTNITDSIQVDDKLQITFDLTLPIDKKENCILKIKRNGFDSLNEQLLRLDTISADGINLKKICYRSKFYPEYPEPWASEQKQAGVELPLYQFGWMEWGWNGIWTLEFETPFYTWLLDNV